MRRRASGTVVPPAYFMRYARAAAAPSASFRQRPPRAAVLHDQQLGLRRPGGAGLVEREPLGAGISPSVEEGLHDAPARLDTIGPLKQDRVPDHAIVDERLVADGRRRCEIILVAERHTHPTDTDRRAWHL